jgi:hypothetical protein
LLKYDLKDAALARLARIVHAADMAEDIDKVPIARACATPRAIARRE